MNMTDLEPNGWEAPLLVVIGMGAGPEDLGTRALEWIRAAEVLVGGRRQLESFEGHPGEKVFLKSPLADQLEEIGRISQYKRTAFLASGDPLFYGIGKTLATAFGRERLFIISNVTSVQTLCSRLGEPWDSIDTVSFHGRKEEKFFEEVLRRLDRGSKTAILTDPVHTPGWLARKLMLSGHEACRIVVGEDLGSEAERIRSFDCPDVETVDFSATNVVLVCPAEGGRGDDEEFPRQVFGFFEEEFERDAGMITKMEVRAVSLALLQLGPGQTIWDLGAGTGSVSIEAARIGRPSRILAVEKNTSRYAQMLTNLGKFGVSHVVEAVCENAADAVLRFPDPDRVFIGGSGEDLGKLLEAVAKRLRPGGRVVQTIVVLQTLETAKSFWKGQQFEVSVTQLQVGRSIPTGRDLRLEALNPVFVLTAWRY